MLISHLVNGTAPLFNVDPIPAGTNVISDINLSRHALQHLSKPIKINVVQTNTRNYTTIIANGDVKMLVNDNFTFGYNGSGPGWLSDAIKEVDPSADTSSITKFYYDENGTDINSGNDSYTLELLIK